MSEEDDKREADKRFVEAQRVEWYAAGLAGWYATRLERDKSLLTLSAGAIGLLITLVTAFGIRSIESLLLLILALGSFICCIGAVLWVLERNSVHIEKAQQDPNTELDQVLGILDKVAAFSFIAGVLLSAVIGIAAAVTSFDTKRIETQMATKTTLGMANDSVNGLTNMRPGNLGKSFNGVANMAPGQQTQATTVAQPQSAPAQAPAASPAAASAAASVLKK